MVSEISKISRHGGASRSASDRVVRDSRSGQFMAVMSAAEEQGLLGDKSDRIAGRVSSALLKQAKKQTGLNSNTELLEFALANVALEDRFAEAFMKARGVIDPDLKLGF